MDLKKQRPSSAPTTHQEEQEEGQLSVIKAAAWAWYQHGSRSGTNTTRESDLLTRTRSPAPRPTRYKLELEGQRSPARLSSGSLLLDLYEIDRITRELNKYLIMGSESESASGSGSGSASGRKETGSKRAAPDRKVNGFWVRQGVGICGSRDDVVEVAVLGGRRRGKPRANPVA